MARSIMEILQEAGPQPITEEVGQLQQKRETGKELPTTTGAVRGNVEEQAALQESEEQRREMMSGFAQQEALRDVQEEQLGIQEEAGRESFRQQIASQKQRYDVATDKLLATLAQGTAQMTTQQEIQALESLGFAQRLGNEKYRAALEMEGRKHRLEDATEFQEALAKSAFEDEIDLFRDNIQFKQIMDLEDAEFHKALADMDVDTALSIAAANAKAENLSGLYRAGGQIAGVAIGEAMRSGGEE